MPDTSPALKKQIAYVGFYSRLLATMIDVAVTMVLFYPLLIGIAWLTFGSHNPMQDIGPMMQPGLAQSHSFSDIAEQLQTNEAFKQYMAENHILLKIALQYVLQSLLLAAFILGFWFYKSATPGKMLLSMQIVDATTFEKPTRGQFVLRLLGYGVSFAGLLLGFLWIAADKRKQGWHDKIAGTVVIKS